MTPAQVKVAIEKMLAEQIEDGHKSRQGGQSRDAAMRLAGSEDGIRKARRILTEALAASEAETEAARRAVPMADREQLKKELAISYLINEGCP